MNDSQLIDRLRGLDAPVDPSPRFSDELFDTLQRERRGGAGRRFRLERPQLLQMAAAGLGVLLIVSVGLAYLSNLNGPAVTPVVVTSPSPAPSPTPSPSSTDLSTPTITLRPVGSDAGPAPAFLPWTESWAGEVAAVVAWRDGLVAVGNRRGSSLHGFARAGSGAIWTSGDGRTWERLTLPDEVDRSDLVEGYVAGSGELVVITAAEDQFRRPAWRTNDGQTWVPVEMPLIQSPHVVGEPGAYLMIDEVSVSAIWESADGLTWDEMDLAALDPNAGVVDIAVGDGGRLIATCDLGEFEIPETLSDGCRTWMSVDGSPWRSSEAFPTQVRAARFGNEWVAAGVIDNESPDRFIQLWRSVDGLAWTASSEIREGFVNAHPDRLFPAGDHLILKSGTSYTRTFACNDSVVCQPSGVDEIIARGAANLGDALVMVGSSFGATGANWTWDTTVE